MVSNSLRTPSQVLVPLRGSGLHREILLHRRQDRTGELPTPPIQDSYHNRNPSFRMTAHVECKHHFLGSKERERERSKHLYKRHAELQALISSSNQPSSQPVAASTSTTAVPTTRIAKLEQEIKELKEKKQTKELGAESIANTVNYLKGEIEIIATSAH